MGKWSAIALICCVCCWFVAVEVDAYISKQAKAKIAKIESDERIEMRRLEIERLKLIPTPTKRIDG